MRPHRRQPTRLRHPWDSPGKNTGVSCHFLLQCMKGKSESEVAQSCPTLSDPMDCSLPGSSVHGIFQARVLEWVAIACSVFLGSVILFLVSWVCNINEAQAMPRSLRALVKVWKAFERLCWASKHVSMFLMNSDKLSMSNQRETHWYNAIKG